MRVTGGILRGRSVRVPDAGVRPTQDRVRQALFSMLGTRIEGAAFLDLFAGSGVVGIEAWSRGARRVAWGERDRRVLQVLRGNGHALCGLTNNIYPMDVEQFLSGTLVSGPYDIIFADPPYGGARGTAQKR
ncbi:MAG: RsmD family RNA methyltransferase, partial [Kiritimatiellae bacterium]|nr:RsmD family RNA methyltransferase [Kiritimatiellia bacterium]